MIFNWLKRGKSEESQSSATIQEVEIPVEDAPTGQGAQLAEDRIAARAYEIWLRKGRPSGLEIQNWLEAEAELRAEEKNLPPTLRIRKPR